MRTLFFLLTLAFTRAVCADALLDEYFTRLAAHGFSGAVLVARGDSVVFRKAYGLADRRKGIANTPETAFNIASLDKQFIAAGILRLEEMGKLRTTDTLDRFFDSVPEDKKAITLHQVLSHTAGFPDEYWDEHETLSRADFIALVLRKPLESPPGTAWSYASFDYWLLEEVIERVAKMPFEQFLRREFFDPLGMHHTGATLPKWGAVAQQQLWTVPESMLPGEGKFSDPVARPAAWRVMLSTVDDLFRWYAAIRGGRVLTAESRRRWMAPVMEDYAYGWYVVPTPRGTKLIHHGGGGGIAGSVATFRWFGDEDTFVAVLNNSLMPGLHADYISADVEHLLFGGEGSMPPPSSPNAARDVAGTYGAIDVIQVPHGPLVARTRDAFAVAALQLGGDQGGMLPQLADDAEARKWAETLGALRDVRVLHTRTFTYNGVPEAHAFLRLRFEKGEDQYVRMVRGIAGRTGFDRLRAGEGIEIVLAPAGDGTFTTWLPRFGGGVRIHFTRDAMKITGSGGSIAFARVKP